MYFSRGLSFSKKNQKGSALIAVLLFSVLASTALVSMQSMVGNTQSMASKVNLDLEFRELLVDIKNIVGNDSFCNSAGMGLMGLRLQSGNRLNSLAAPTRLQIDIPGANRNVFGPGWKNASGTLRFHRLDWVVEKVEPDRYARATAVVRSKKILYNLIVEMKRCETQACNNPNTEYFTNRPRSNGSINRNAIKIPIYVHLQANSSYNVISGARVVSCFGEGTGPDFCEKIGSVWNPNASSFKFKCEPLENCSYRKALRSGQCGLGSQLEITKRFKPLIEGVGTLKSPSIPLTRTGIFGITLPAIPETDLDLEKMNISNCVWCNENL